MMRSASGDADARGAASTFSIAIVPPGGDDVGGASGRRDAQLVPEGAPQAQQACGVLTWEGLTVTVRDAKGRTRQILKRADGIVHPGQLLAVMGPSGCGKSTLLDTLAGRLSPGAALQGAVNVNGHSVQLAYGRSAYVTQDEVLIGTLTVRETLVYAAHLRLRGGAGVPSPAEVADGVIAELGLTDAAHTVIGNWHMRGVSGGQRRRVVIGCELVISPTLLFLDEPTSGLDAAAAFHVTGVIKRLCASGGRCKTGRTILCVIHQPASEVFEQFDTLALLAEGATIYFGPAQSAADFFGSVGLPTPRNRSASDHLLHTVNAGFGNAKEVADNVERVMAAYEASPMHAAMKERIAAIRANPGPMFESGQQPPPAWRQTLVLTQRTFTNNWRDLGVFWVRVAMYTFLCLVIGFIYFRMKSSWKDVYSRAALLFFVCAFLTFMSISGFPAFVEDMKVFTRERLNGYYGVATFVAANSIASIPFIALIAITSSCAVYFIAGLNLSPFSRFVYFVLDLFMALLTVESIMMSIAPLVPHFLMGIAAGAGLLGFLMLVCGFFQPRSQLPRPVLFYPAHFLSFQSYSFFGFMRNEFEGTHGWGCPCTSQPGGCSDAQGGAACKMDGAAVLHYWDVPHWNKWYVTITALAGWTLLFRCLFFLACKTREWRSRGRGK